MHIALIMPNRDTKRLKSAIEAIDTTINVSVWPDISPADTVQFAVLWAHPRNIWEKLPALRAVTSLGAGVEFIVNDASRPNHIQVGRIVDSQLATDMARYLLGVVLQRSLHLERFAQQQARQIWKPKRAANPTIGVLGLGQMGANVAIHFAQLGFSVGGWSTSQKQLENVNTYSGADGLRDMASQSQVLINLLPLTPATTGILNSALFDQFDQACTLINVGRGAHLVETDLIAGLKNGQPHHAILDVFCEEPLAKDHPFWAHPDITITPHVASLTDPDRAAQIIVASAKQVERGEQPLYKVNLEQGY